MRILNEEQAKASLERPNNLAHKIQKIKEIRENDRTEISQDHIPGRDKGTENVPHFLRPIIAAEARLANHQDVADAYGLGKSTVDGYATGRIGGSLPAGEKAGLRRETEKRLEPVRSRALDLVMQGLNIIGEEDRLGKIKKTKDLVAAVGTLAKVHQNLMPKTEESGSPDKTLIVYAPNMKTLADFTTQDV